MKVTRRGLGKIMAAGAAATGALSMRTMAQAPAAAPANPMVEAQRGDFRSAARLLAEVKIPRATEPATRFEA